MVKKDMQTHGGKGDCLNRGEGDGGEGGGCLDASGMCRIKCGKLLQSSQAGGTWSRKKQRRKNCRYEVGRSVGRKRL